MKLKTVFGREPCDLNEEILADLLSERIRRNAYNQLGQQLYFEFIYMCGNMDDKIYSSIRVGVKTGKWEFVKET